MKQTRGIIVAAAVLVALVAGGLWLRGFRQRLRAEGALAEAMKNASTQRRADSLALAAAQDSLSVARAALDRSAASVATSAGNWQSVRATRPAVLESFTNPPAADAAPAASVVDSVLRYARALERSGDSLSRACTSLRGDCEAFRAQAAVTMARQDTLRADVQRQLDIAIRQAKNRPGAVSRWTRNAGLFLAGVGAGLVLERVR